MYGAGGRGGSENTTDDDECVVPFSLRRKGVGVGMPFAGLSEPRGFRARERVPFSGGLGGVELVGSSGRRREGGGERKKGKGKGKAREGDEGVDEAEGRGRRAVDVDVDVDGDGECTCLFVFV
jgi:hypothetical protein